MFGNKRKNLEKKKNGLLTEAAPAEPAAGQTDPADQAMDRSVLETGPDIDSANASIGCVPAGPEDPAASNARDRKNRRGPRRKKRTGFMGLFRRKR